MYINPGMRSYHSSCLICESKKLLTLKGYEKHDLVKCSSCSFVFMRAIPSADELNAHYSRYTYNSEKYLSPITIKSYNLLLDEFERYRKSNRILDVGCGAGFFLDQAKKRGWEVYGTEYSTRAVEVCKAKGINMKEGVLQRKNFDEADFDVITSFEVIEHINNPIKEVDEIYAILRKGGLFYCTTPNFNSLLRFYLKDDYNIISYPEHLCYFTNQTLHKVLKKAGFVRDKMLSTGISVTRFKTSSGVSQEEYIGENTADEKLRREIEQKWYLSAAKKAVNNLLTLTSTGMTLKGYYKKV
jgi:2-polyprenyl-3-methyl-5-hydroxy-6-metoxy-1,4-benzoquinol methylase